MSKKDLSSEYRLSRVSLESVRKADLALKGVDLSSKLVKRMLVRQPLLGGCFVKIPSGEFIWISEWEDGGVVYKIEENYTIEDRKFIQRLFAKAKCLSSSPHLESSGEERKKGTSDVSEFVAGTSEDVHGGDSASGEVPDGRSGGGKEVPPDRSSIPPVCSAPSAGASEYSADAPTAPAQSRQDGSDSDSHKSPAAAGGCGDSDKAGSSLDGPALKSRECAASTQMGEDALQAGAEACREGTGGLPIVEIIDGGTRESSTVPSTGGAREGASEPGGEVPSISFKDLREKMRELSSSLGSLRSNNSFGGVYASFIELGISPREFVNRGRRVFSKLISDLAEGEAGPRWDYKKVSARIASLQTFKIKDRKNETGRPAIAVLPDVSGSMVSFTWEVLEFAKVLGELGVPGAEVVIIPHSNGWPDDLLVNNRRRKLDAPVRSGGEAQQELKEWYQNIFKRYDVKVVVIAADWDGEWLYHWMAENLQIKIFWCDVWSSSRFAPTVVDFPPRWVGKIDWSRSAVKKVKYAFGCGNVVDFIVALEKMVKQRR
jgi:hypothetical protein